MKVRLALDMCKLAHRHGDHEKLKRALETVCILYDVDPTELTCQGLGSQQAVTKEKKGEEEARDVEMATLPSQAPERVAASSPSNPRTSDLDNDIGNDVRATLDAQPTDEVMDAIDRFINDN